MVTGKNGRVSPGERESWHLSLFLAIALVIMCLQTITVLLWGVERNSNVFNRSSMIVWCREVEHKNPGFKCPDPPVGFPPELPD